MYLALAKFSILNSLKPANSTPIDLTRISRPFLTCFLLRNIMQTILKFLIASMQLYRALHRSVSWLVYPSRELKSKLEGHSLFISIRLGLSCMGPYFSIYGLNSFMQTTTLSLKMKAVAYKKHFTTIYITNNFSKTFKNVDAHNICPDLIS